MRERAYLGTTHQHSGQAACYCRETIRRRIAGSILHADRLGKRLLRVDLTDIRRRPPRNPHCRHPQPQTLIRCAGDRHGQRRLGPVGKAPDDILIQAQVRLGGLDRQLPVQPPTHAQVELARVGP